MGDLNGTTFASLDSGMQPFSTVRRAAGKLRRIVCAIWFAAGACTGDIGAANEAIPVRQTPALACEPDVFCSQDELEGIARCQYRGQARWCCPKTTEPRDGRCASRSPLLVTRLANDSPQSMAFDPLAVSPLNERANAFPDRTVGERLGFALDDNGEARTNVSTYEWIKNGGDPASYAPLRGAALAGARWIRFGASEPLDDEQLGKTRGAIAALLRAGFNVDVSIAYWSALKDPADFFSDAFITRYGQHAGRVASALKGFDPTRIRIEVWNEPNINGNFWPTTSIDLERDPKHYAKMVVAATEAIRAEGATVDILAGSVSNLSDGAKDGALYLERFLVEYKTLATGHPFVSGISIHPYGGMGNAIVHARRIVHAVLGNAALPIFATEYGSWYENTDDPALAGDIRERSAAFAPIVMLETNVASLSFWTLRDGYLHEGGDAAIVGAASFFLRPDSTWPDVAPCARNASFAFGNLNGIVDWNCRRSVNTLATLTALLADSDGKEALHYAGSLSDPWDGTPPTQTSGVPVEPWLHLLQFKTSPGLPLARGRFRITTMIAALSNQIRTVGQAVRFTRKPVVVIDMQGRVDCEAPTRGADGDYAYPLYWGKGNRYFFFGSSIGAPDATLSCPNAT